MSTDQITDLEFFYLCQEHDWWFELSSDRKRHQAGRKTQGQINIHVLGSDLRARIRDDWRDYRVGPRETMPRVEDYEGLM